MATKRSNDNLDVSSSKKLKTNAPKLSIHARKIYLYFQLTKNQPAHGIRIIEKQLRVLTVNSQFLNAFFLDEGNDHEMPELGVVTVYNMQLKFYFNKLEIFVQPYKIGHLIVPLQLAAMKKLKICIQTYAGASFRKTTLSNWILVCRVLAENKTLENLHFYMKSLSSSTNRVIVDLLPDKIVEFRISDDIMSCLNNKRKTLESLILSECHKRKNLSYIFKAKTKHLTFARAPWNGGSGRDGLLSLASCGRLSSNPSIEHLTINIQFAPVKKSEFFFFELEYDEPDNETSTSYLPEYERALKCLQMVNRDMLLELKDNNSYKENPYTDYKKVIEDLELLIKNVMEFVELAERIGTKIKSIHLKHKYKIEHHIWSRRKNVEIAKKFAFELFPEGNELHGTRLHNGIPIYFDQQLVRDNPNFLFGCYYLSSDDNQDDDSDDAIVE